MLIKIKIEGLELQPIDAVGTETIKELIEIMVEQYQLGMPDGYVMVKVKDNVRIELQRSARVKQILFENDTVSWNK